MRSGRRQADSARGASAPASRPVASTPPAYASRPLVESRLCGHVAWIEFGDPAQRNLLTEPLLEALPPALAAAAAQAARVVVLRGRGEFFSAGYDISRIPAQLFDAEPETALSHPFERCMRAVVDCPLPTIAAVNGHAIGGALELAASCDLQLARAGARLGITAARLGLVYPHTGLEKIVRLLGVANARRLLFTGDLVDAEEAERLGLVNQVVPASGFDAAVEALALRIAACSPLAVQGMKQVLRIVERGAPIADAEVRAILALRQRSYHSEDFSEGRAAFDAKREPRFRGR